MTALDKVLGALLIGSYANSILYAMEGIAVTQYYSASKRNRDCIPLQAVVYFTFAVDTVSTISTYASVYLYTVTHWGDVIYLQRQYWPTTVTIATNGITATIVQCFLIYRYWKISQNNYVASVLSVLMFAAAGGGVGTVVSLLVYTAVAQRDKLVLNVMIWFGTSVATDTAISVALLWQLSRIKSHFEVTQSLIHRLMISTIQTGAITSVAAVVTLMLFLIDNQSNASGGLGFCSARIYALTMLYTLNNRGALKHEPPNTNDPHDREMSNVVDGTNGSYVCTVAAHCGSSINQGPLEPSDRSRTDSDLFVSPRQKASLSLLGSRTQGLYSERRGDTVV